MKVAFDIATYPVFRDGDLYYPGMAALLAILHSGGIAIIYKSHGEILDHERRILDKLVEAFRGKIIVSADDRDADMNIV